MFGRVDDRGAGTGERGRCTVTSGSARWWALAVVTLGFTAAAFLVPWHAASAITGLTWAGPRDLAGSVGHALVADWASAVPAPGGQASSALTDPTRFWRWFHIAKAVLALAALVSAIVLATRAWRARRDASTTPRRFAWAGVTSIGSLFAALSAVLVVANVQGAVAPMSSVLSFLPMSGRSPALVNAVTGLNTSIGSGHPTSTATAIVRDFATYHAVVAVLLALVTVLAGIATVRVTRARRWGSGVLLAATVTILAVLTLANTSTAFAPAPALQSFLSGVA
jgi:hypothetical protein